MPESNPSIALVTGGFSFPTSMARDNAGNLFVAESGLPFAGAAPGGRIWRIAADGSRTLLAEGLRPPVTGLMLYEGELYVSEGGHPGGISRLGQDGDLTTVVTGLPGPGNYHTNMAVAGPDGKIYFSQGAMTNTGIVGLDAYELGWLRRLPHAHDIPGRDIVLAGVNVETANPLVEDPGARITTGAFMPFGTPSRPGQRIAGEIPCTAAVLRCNPDGSDLELVAWGVRNGFGLAFLPDGRLLVTDQGADDRGSRPVGNIPDMLYEIRPGAWYGWPDFVGGDPITDPEYVPTRGPSPTFLLANHNDFPLPERPLLRFPSHAAAVKFAIVPDSAPRWAGQIFVALFGDEAPMTAPSGPRVGRSVGRIDPGDWSLHDVIGEPLSRPIDIGFDQAGEVMFILDFGQFEMTTQGVAAVPGTGCLWRLPLATLE